MVPKVLQVALASGVECWVGELYALGGDCEKLSCIGLLQRRRVHFKQVLAVCVDGSVLHLRPGLLKSAGPDPECTCTGRYCQCGGRVWSPTGSEGDPSDAWVRNAENDRFVITRHVQCDQLPAESIVPWMPAASRARLFTEHPELMSPDDPMRRDAPEGLLLFISIDSSSDHHAQFD